MAKSILGIHHITAIAGEPEDNIAFYTGVLGLRLVKITVNFDDPASYHLYYGDGHGHPGTILTFFTWPGARRGRIGNSQLTATSFAIPPGAGQFWRERFLENGIAFSLPAGRFGEPVLAFTDPDGLRLELIETPRTESVDLWSGSGVPPGAAIDGFHSATLSESGYERTAALLTETMGLHLTASEQSRYRYEVTNAGPGKTIDVVCSPEGLEGRVAVGTVHHIAWRTPDNEEQLQWQADLLRLGYNLSPVMDRQYFHSIYYREPGGILFEIATDPPGFATDEPLEELGTGLKLPPWFESQRAEIEASLPAIRVLRKASAK